MIVLAGGTARLPQLAEVVSEQIGIPAIIANPFARLTFAPSINVEDLLNDAPSLLVCCGLAMRSYHTWYREQKMQVLKAAQGMAI
jgi:type IV pilus assembly protein PilM